MTRTVVVVGHGMVGHRFVESLRRRDTAHEWRVIVLPEESRPAYDRVALSSYIEDKSEDDLALADEGFFDDEGVDLTAPPDGWTRVCPLERLQPERGAAALVAGEPVAVFRTRDDRLHALHNVDPFSRASVLSRGIVGDVAGAPVVASPLHKQHFALETGTAIEDDTVTVAVYPVRVVDGVVEVGSP